MNKKANIKPLHADFLEDLEIGQGRSAKTVENYDHYLQRFYKEQAISDTADITLDSVRQFRRHLQEKFTVSLATQNYHLIALRQFLKYLAKRDIAALSAEKIGLAKLGDRDIDILYPEEVDALLAAADPSSPLSLNRERGGGEGSTEVDIARLRDHALLQTLFATGLRVSEAVNLDRDDIRTSGEIPVRGKGNKVRVVFLSPAALSAIEAYVALRHDTDPALFINYSPAKSTDETASLRLTPRGVQRMIKKYAVLAGLTKDISPHTLRHSFATDLLSNGADVRQVQQLLGHASITTTQVYTHLTDVHLKEVHAKFHRRPSS